MESAGAVEPHALTHTRVRTGLHLLVDGHLNPLIFVPEWFRREDLLREEEVDTAEATLSSSPSFLAFKTSDFSFVVSLNSLEIFSNRASLELVLRDLVLNIFTSLRHTPVTALTVSRSAHLAGLANSTNPPLWPSILNISSFEPLLGQPTVVDISAKGSAGPTLEGAQVTISLQPSTVRDADLFIECKYSYDLPSDEGVGSVDILPDILKSAIDTTKDHSEAIYSTFSSLLLRAPESQPGHGQR